MATIQDYVEKPNTPSAGSPVGILMARILEKNPGIGFEEAHHQAKAFLAQAAGRKIYRLPRVLSLEEQVAEKDRLKNAFGTLRKAA